MTETATAPGEVAAASSSPTARFLEPTDSAFDGVRDHFGTG